MTFAEMIASEYFTTYPGTDTTGGIVHYGVAEGYEVETVEGEPVKRLEHRKGTDILSPHWFLVTDESSYYFDMHENVVIHVELVKRINLGVM